MNAPFSQSARRGRLTTPLGGDALVLLRMDGREALCGGFAWEVEALAATDDVDLDALLGEHATVAVDMAGGTRHFDGIVAEARRIGPGENGWRYGLVLRDWLHLASLRRNMRIFHRMTAPAILTELLADYADGGDPHLEDRLGDSYPEWEYTVQYGESDAAFAQRIMERAGITWAWRHAPGSHTLVLVDDPLSLPDVPGGTRPYKPYGRHHMADEEHFHDWQAGARVTTGAVRLTEWNFHKPRAGQQVDQAGDAAHAQGRIESFDWPGDYLAPGGGPDQARTAAAKLLQAERGGAVRHRASGDVAGLGAGICVTPTGDRVADVTGRRFVCLSATHRYRAQAYGTGDAGGRGEGTDADQAYMGEYVLMPDDAPLRPPRRVPRPRVHGPQTAIVVGEGEIDCDDLGRILVRFHWDLDAKHSMRCRVVQANASRRYGGMAIPRIGMEVVVEHLEGDPDRPIVTGCVYHADHDRPYALPAHKTKRVIREDSHQGEGFNEISFEAQSGRENMAFHAQKDQTFRVLNDQSSNIGANRVEQVGANHSTQINANRMERVGANKSTSVGGGGPLGLLQVLMPLVQAGGKFMQKNASRGQTGEGVGGFATGIAGVAAMPGELAAIAQKGMFAASGGHRDAGGAAQLGQAGIMSRLLGLVMPGGGTMSTVVERYLTTTVGQAATEQVGLAKNTVVGNVMSTSVGKLMTTKVGEDYELETKKSIFNRTVTHTLHAKEKFVIAGPGGSITIDKSGVTIRTKHLKVKSPSVDFTSGSPSQLDALSSDKAFVQECKGK
ncbi:type VI secretion system Vgr family protein [Jannaschia sp. LMIT008]|uniref:type VI secretion system Vgr family protein n=1 Tax=Jannaschia maritima TaxID=3032585 RepID=UPI002810D378|nr:type VI secretion system tip protein TssI/VgrG [Jannaschia sp. LMIT008]